MNNLKFIDKKDSKYQKELADDENLKDTQTIEYLRTFLSKEALKGLSLKYKGVEYEYIY